MGEIDEVEPSVTDAESDPVLSIYYAARAFADDRHAARVQTAQWRLQALDAQRWQQQLFIAEQRRQQQQQQVVAAQKMLLATNWWLWYW